MAGEDDLTNRHGPKVGSSFVTDKHTNQSVPVSVHALKDGPKRTEYTVVDPKGRSTGSMKVTDHSEQDLRQAESSGQYHANHEKLNYGNDPQNKYKSKTYVDSMRSSSISGYKGAGKLLHQIAAEHSVQNGNEGRVQLRVGGLGGMNDSSETPGTSAGFHEGFGYRGQDVYNEDGSLHHEGQDMHEKLANETWDEAQVNKSIGGDYWPPEGGIQKSPATFMEKDKPEMYLPDDVIDRERSRMQENPILDASKNNEPKDRDSLIAEAKSRIPGLNKPKGEVAGGAPGKKGLQALNLGPKGKENSSDKNSADGKGDPEKKGVLNAIKNLTSDIKNLKGDGGGGDGKDGAPSLDSLKDPTKLGAELGDKYLHLGKKVGHLLFITWLIVMAAGYALFFFPALIGLFMLNLLVISPKWCFRLTKWILYLIPVVGEVVKGLDEVGISNLKVEILPVEKYSIIAINVMYFIQMLAVFAFIMAIGCWAVGGVGGTVASWLDQTGVVSTLKDFCPK